MDKTVNLVLYTLFSLKHFSGGLTLTVIGSRLDGLGKFITTDLIGIKSGQSSVDTTSKVSITS